ncbi:hypothetical protein ACIRQH_32190 [Streptomyces sp. NPDC102279]|uniref:hypothetical protein n=1 Tax=Streptomyces sp. NPDC102279 TaxID=3366153 RepID=UPI00381CAB04
MATPHVTGAAAVHLAGHRVAAPARVAAAPTAGKISDPGTGTPDRLLKVVE